MRGYLIFVVLTLIAVCLSGCSSPLIGFNAKKIYIADNFTDRTLSGFSVCTGPFYNLKGEDITDTINLQRDINALKTLRKDLRFTSFSEVKQQLVLRSGTSACDSLFLLLATGSTVQIQLLDSLWHALDCDYLMVMRLRDAMNMHTFDNVKRKRIRVEAELWSVKNQEVVWRYEIFGIAEGMTLSDRSFINSAISKVYESLPATVPAYESGKW